jgi:hypothetical protein
MPVEKIIRRVPLADFATAIVTGLPQVPCRCRVDRVKEDHYTFSANNLPQVPPMLVTHDLIVNRMEHGYGNCIRIDQLHFYASGETHRQLAVLILATVFSGKSERIMLDLENEQSTIKHLEINYRGFNQAWCWGYVRRPAHFRYHPQIPERVPQDWPRDDRDLPTFDLDFMEGGRHHPVNDLDKRDKVVITGDDNGLVLVAELLLNIGLPACDIPAGEGSMPPDKSYVLEGFPGHHKVDTWSAEAQFHLPGSFSWPGEYPTLGK